MKRFQKDCIGDIVSIADLTLSPAGGLAALPLAAVVAVEATFGDFLVT